MAANAGAVDHVLPVVGQSEIDQRLQESIPDALFCPAPEPDIDRVPLAVLLVHVAPRAADPQHMQHPIEEAPIIARWPRPATMLRRQQRPNQFPFSIRQIPAAHNCSSKSSLESQLGVVGNPFCQHGLDRFGQVDGLVNCAGIIRMGSVVETELKDFQSVLEVNVIGTFLAMKNILPVMLNKGEGSIVNISSTAGIAGAPGAAAYCASKGAVRMLSKSAALDALALPGAVRVNSLHPAMTETPMVQTIVDQLGGGASIEDQMRAQQPSGQFITPDAVVDAIVFLLGDGSRFVNGSEMLVDNGFTAQ